MPTKIVQIATTAQHILALDDSGVIWWRRWDKKGWNKMEQVPLETPVSPTVVHAGPVIAAMPTLFPPVNVPTPSIPAPDMKSIDSLVHKDPA